jgi:decaprenylphospho-beta-D-ribofuranose 2-oxidase
MNQEYHRVGSWGLPALRKRRVLLPENSAELANWLAEEGASCGLRGMARSYGDAPLADLLISTRRWRQSFELDADKGLLQADAGFSLSEVVKRTLPEGWMPIVLPGTGHVSLGGAVACDVHGKNHHVDGAFSRHIEELTILDSHGVLHHCSRQQKPELFAAACGGMGLCGCITQVVMRLMRVNGDTLQRRAVACQNLDQALQHLLEDGSRYTVSWVNASRGPGLGRSIVYKGEWKAGGDRVRLHKKARLAPPRSWPINMVRPFTMRAFSELVWLAGSRKSEWEDEQHYASFFWPLDKLRAWNRLYGPKGFLQFQCLLPMSIVSQKGAGPFMDLLKLFAASGGSGLAVMKTMGPEERYRAEIAFPGEGATLAVDLPNGQAQRMAVQAAHKLVLKHSGRIYLAKDTLLSPSEFRESLSDPGLWQKQRDTFDPDRRWQTDLSQRLEL